MCETDMLEELIIMANELKQRIRDILDGSLKAYDADLQQWTTESFMWLPEMVPPAYKPIHNAIEACLVDILSCDNASWDTPETGFRMNLEKLESTLMMHRK